MYINLSKILENGDKSKIGEFVSCHTSCGFCGVIDSKKNVFSLDETVVNGFDLLSWCDILDAQFGPIFTKKLFNSLQISFVLLKAMPFSVNVQYFVYYLPLL